MLKYWLELGPREQAILERCRRERMPVPERIANAPELYLGLQFFMDAFYDLTTDRQMGPAGIGPIPWSSIRRYCEDKQLTGEQREDMYYFLRKLDAEYIQHHIDKMKT